MKKSGLAASIVAIVAGGAMADDLLITTFDETFDAVYPGSYEGSAWLFPDGSDGGNDYLLPDVFDNPFVTVVQDPGDGNVVGPSQGSHALQIVHYCGWPPAPSTGAQYIDLAGGDDLMQAMMNSDGFAIDAILPFGAEWGQIFGIVQGGTPGEDLLGWTQSDAMNIPCDNWCNGAWTSIEVLWADLDNDIHSTFGPLIGNDEAWVSIKLVPQGGGGDCVMFLDNFRLLNYSDGGGCNGADQAEPYGELNIDDVLAYLAAFAAGDLAADLAPVGAPDGSLDIDDVLEFLGQFAAGCP